jgi:hypothetical protein
MAFKPTVVFTFPQLLTLLLGSRRLEFFKVLLLFVVVMRGT